MEDQEGAERIITELKPITKTKFHVFINGEYAFALRAADIKRHKLREGGEIKPDAYDAILREELPKRGREYLIRLLSVSDKTVYQVRGSMTRAGYPESVIDEVVDFGIRNRFLEDRRYAENYIDYRIHSKGRIGIRGDLSRKGIPADMIDEILDTYEAEVDIEAMRKLLEKKFPERTGADYNTRQKAAAFLARRGFPFDEIREVTRAYFE